MYFAEEDELAVHTVASAAYGLLRDLKAERGLDEAADNYLVSVFYLVRDFRRGTLPKHLADDAALMSVVRQWADQFPIGPDTKLHEISASVSPEAARLFWRERSKIANFLKHADRDVDAAIANDQVDNLMLLLQAYNAYQDLTAEKRTNEGIVFELYIGAKEEHIRDPESSVGQIRRTLAGKAEAERRSMCVEFIKDLNMRDGGHAV